MSTFSKHQRQTEPEIMDLPDLPNEDIRLAISEIEKINRLFGGFYPTLSALKHFPAKKEVYSLQDWGCGSGDLLRKISKWSKKRGYSFDLVGIDRDSETIQLAREKTLEKEISFKCLDVFSPELIPESVDIVSSCLFTHHFNNEEWVLLIQKMFSVCRKGVIINDLHRHPIPYYVIGLLTKWFAKSYMVKNDASLSVAKGFKRTEIISLLNKAGISRYSIQWKWAFRWIIIIKKS